MKENPDRKKHVVNDDATIKNLIITIMIESEKCTQRGEVNLNFTMLNKSNRADFSYFYSKRALHLFLILFLSILI